MEGDGGVEGGRDKNPERGRRYVHSDTQKDNYRANQAVKKSQETRIRIRPSTINWELDKLENKDQPYEATWEEGERYRNMWVFLQMDDSIGA